MIITMLGLIIIKLTVIITHYETVASVVII